MDRRVALFVLNDFVSDSRVLREAISLQKAGYEPTVVARHRPGLQQREDIQGIPVHRIKLKTADWPKTIFFQLFKYRELIRTAVKEYKDYPLLHCNDLNALPIGARIKRKSRGKAKLFYDSHEYQIERNKMSKTVLKVSYQLEKRLIKKVDELATVSPEIADEYMRIYGIRPEVIMNCPYYMELNSEQDIFRGKFSIPKESLIFLYQGGLKFNRGVEELLDAFTELDNDHHVVFLGNGELEDKIRRFEAEHNNIHFHPGVDYFDLMQYTASADAGFYFVKNNCLSHDFSLGNKLFEYIMAEIPVISSNLTSPKKLFEEYPVGWVMEDFRPKTLADWIRKANKELLWSRREELKKAKKVFSWEEQEKVLLNIYDRMEKK